MAEHLIIHTTLVSQIMRGTKCLTEEQASILCSYMKLNVLETDYFLKLVQLERAGSENLKSIFRRHIEHIKNEANEVKNQIQKSVKLSRQDQAIFYSSWQYAVIRLLTSIEGTQTPQQISSYLTLPLSRVQAILDFLVATKLCNKIENKYIRTDQNTHIDSQSELVVRHHQNWRIRSLEFIEHLQNSDLVFSSPIALAKNDIPKVRKILLNTISEIAKIVDESSPEAIAYLGIDWMSI